MILYAPETAHLAIAAFGALQKQEEFEKLLNLLEIHNPRVVVEIGVGNGGSSWAFSKLPFIEKLIAIDLPSGPWGGKESLQTINSFQYIANNNSSCKVNLVAGNSQNAECLNEVKRLLEGREIDFLFIDGDHSYAGVKTDFLTYSPLVKRDGGLIGFHDIAIHPPETKCEVQKFWEELKQANRNPEGGPQKEFHEYLSLPVNWGGISVIEW